MDPVMRSTLVSSLHQLMDRVKNRAKQSIGLSGKSPYEAETAKNRRLDGLDINMCLTDNLLLTF